MEFFGINGGEALVLCLLALLLVGPRQAVELIGRVRTVISGILAFSSRLRANLAQEVHLAPTPEQRSLSGELGEWANMATALASAPSFPASPETSAQTAATVQAMAPAQARVPPTAGALAQGSASLPQSEPRKG